MKPRVYKILHRVERIWATQYKDRVQVVVLCLIAATTFWFFNALNKNYTTKITYPISFEYDEKDLIVIGKLPNRISLNLTGVGWNFLRKTFWFNIEPLKIPLEHPEETKYITGNTLFSLVSDQMKGMKLNYVATDTLFLNIERRVEKKIPIVVDTHSIKIAQRFEMVSSIKIDPDSVVVSGPMSVVATLHHPLKVALPNEILEDDYSEDLEIINPLNSKYLNISPEEVKVSFKISEFFNKRIRVPVNTQNFPKDSSVLIHPHYIYVTYRVAEELVNKVNETDFKAIVNYKKVPKDDSVASVVITDFPAYISSFHIENRFLRIIRKKL